MKLNINNMKNVTIKDIRINMRYTSVLHGGGEVYDNYDGMKIEAVYKIIYLQLPHKNMVMDS